MEEKKNDFEVYNSSKLQDRINQLRKSQTKSSSRDRGKIISVVAQSIRQQIKEHKKRAEEFRAQKSKDRSSRGTTPNSGVKVKATTALDSRDISN